MVKFHAFILLLALLVSCKKEEDSNQIPLDPATESLPINKVQYIGTHNSYRRLTDAGILGFVKKLGNILPESLDPSSWEYDHKPIPYQLDRGLRSLELDIYFDPNGGRFANRLGNVLVGKPVETNLPDLKKPGMKLLHIPDLDYNTNYLTFKLALQSIKGWSDAHPQHLPIFVLVELKTKTVGDILPIFTTALPFTKGAMDSIDQEIDDIFGKGSNKIYTPDMLRGIEPNLKTAIAKNGWPTVSTMRGKIIFITYKNSNYLIGSPNLENRRMFQFSDLDSPNAAFILLDKAKVENDTIKLAVENGYIARTNTDGGTTEARNGDYTTMENAFSSGAQILSTDYYEPSYNAGKKGWSYYQVSFEDRHFARVNVLNNSNGIKGKLIRE